MVTSILKEGKIDISLKNTKNIYDLVQNAAMVYKDKAFIRYEKNEVIYEKSYEDLANDCNSISVWVEKKNIENGRKHHIGLLGRFSYEYIVALLGITSAESIAVPLDVQLSEEGLINNIKAADIDIMFYDWEFKSQIEIIKERCSNIKQFVCIQNIGNDYSIEKILQKYINYYYVSKVKEDNCAMIIFTSETIGKEVMLSHKNLIHNTFCYIEKENQEDEVFLNVLPIHHIFCLIADINKNIDKLNKYMNKEDQNYLYHIK